MKATTFNDFVNEAGSEGTKCSFIINDASLGVVNAVRRVVLSEIPNIAVGFDAYHPENNDTKFFANTSSLHNEFIGHRLSLVPIHVSSDVIDGFDPSMYKFVINQHNTGTEPQLVTSEHIQVFNNDNVELPLQTVRNMFPADRITKDFILITKLKPNLYDSDNGEKLHVEFRARKGIAKHNAAWSPVSLCSYTFVIDPKAEAEGLKAKLAGIDEKDERDKAKKVFKTLENQRFYYKNEYGEPSKYKFSIETECALTPQYLVTKAFDLLINKFQELAKGDNYEVHTINEEHHFYAISISNEDHTFGNLLQTMIYDNYIRPRKDVTYAGYNMPHPLEPTVVVKVRFDKRTDVKQFIHGICALSVEQLRGIQSKWGEFVGAAVAPAAPVAIKPPVRRITTRKPAK